MLVKTYCGVPFHGANVGKMSYSQDFLSQWLIATAKFECWVNVLADNDNAPAAPELYLRPEEIPSVSWLSFY